MRPSCITEKMMKTIGNAAEPSQTTNSSHLQPMSAAGRQKTTQPLPTLAPRFCSRAHLSCEVSPPESPNTLAKFRQTTQMGAYGRHQVSRVPPVAAACSQTSVQSASIGLRGRNSAAASGLPRLAFSLQLFPRSKPVFTKLHQTTPNYT
jgi:hypothetical protein